MTADNDIVISTKNLSKVYKLYKNPKDRLKEALSLSGKIYHKDFYALKDINLEIKRGEVIGIVGKNGSGKSTLLKILSRVLTPTSGEFMVKGKVSSLLELGSGFNPELTGLENVYFYGTILGFTEEKIKDKLQEILDFADIGDFIFQPLKTYSSGMKSRLAFSVAINVDPDILILDEVLAVGDELFRRKCYARMEEFFKGQKTVLFVSHSVSDINQLCTRAIMIDKGELILEGPSKLVTILYQKFLFSLKHMEKAILSEIKTIRNDEVLVQTVLSESKGKNSLNEKFDKTASNKDVSSRIIFNKALLNKDVYVDGYKPKSTIVYKNFDVEIFDLFLLNYNNDVVNNINMFNQYKYCYKVKFNIAVSKVTFGMAIKNERGLLIFGASYPSLPENASYIKNVQANDTYLVEWVFNNNLMPGTYYTNVGTKGNVNGEIVFLNRIVDAMVFKVIKPDVLNARGIVDLFDSVMVRKVD